MSKATGLLAMLIEHSNRDFYTQAACVGVDADLFFPPRGDFGVRAKRVCLDCCVRGQCLWVALHTPERQGIWGGTASRQRERMRHDTTVMAMTAEQLQQLPVYGFNGGRRRFERLSHEGA